MVSNGGFIIAITILYVFAFIHAEEIDLIADLNRLTKAKPYIRQQKTWIQDKTIWYLNLTDNKIRQLYLSTPTVKDILNQFIQNKDFTICVNLQQIKSSFGTVFSITTRRNLRLFEMKVSPKRNLVKVIYLPDWPSLHNAVEKLEYNVSTNQWHSLCFEYTGHNNVISVRSDCYEKVTKKLQFQFPNKIFRLKTQMNFQIWIGQRTGQKSYFKGIIKQMIFSTKYNFSTAYCASLLENENLTPMSSLVGSTPIEFRLNVIDKEIRELKMKLQESEEKLKSMKQCQCFPLCISSTGEKKSFTETWKESECRNCTCTHDGKQCDEEKCPNLKCESKLKELGKCCQRCGNTCQYHGKKYHHETNFTINCLRCYCNDGSLNCRRINLKRECPPLNCNRVLQVKAPGKCCKMCKQINLCDISNCGNNAFCVPSSAVFICQCKPGFYGNPYKHCSDINECSNKLICPASTECINTEGSFTCICKPGYIRLNSSADGCTATCIKNRCKNNSSCVAPDKCECSVGYSGDQCDIDIDECKLEIIKCPLNSECFNIPGSYICRCVNGYRPKTNDTISVYYDHQCGDINECFGIRGVDFLCDVYSTCVNTPGGYECISNILKMKESGCGIEKANSDMEIVPYGREIIQLEACKRCSCFDGKLLCSSIKCDCISDFPKSCCRKCYKNECNSTLFLNNATEDEFVCSTHNSSCANKECPKLNCHNTIDISGQCCKFCQSDPITSCLLEYKNPSSVSLVFDRFMSTCSFNRNQYQNGEKFNFQSHADGSCIKCLCWNQYFCCAKSFNCSS